MTTETKPQSSPPEANGNGPENPSLASKLADVMGEVGAVTKKGYNDFHHYSYVTEADLFDAVREKLAAKRVFVLPSVESFDERELQHFDKDTGQVRFTSTLTRVGVRLRFIDGDSGDSLDCLWYGEGDDDADKGAYKAYTGALKYAVMKTFLIPTGDDPEADRRTDERSAAGGSRRSAPTGPAVAKDRISEKQAKRAFALKKANGVSDVEWAALLKMFEVPSVETLAWKVYEDFCSYLERKQPIPVAQTDVPADMEGLTAEFDAVTDVPFS